MDEELVEFLRQTIVDENYLPLDCQVIDKVTQKNDEGTTPSSYSDGMGGTILKVPDVSDTVNVRPYKCRVTVPNRDAQINEFTKDERQSSVIRIELILPHDAEIYLTSTVKVTDEQNIVKEYQVDRLQPYTNVITRHVTCSLLGDKG